MKIDETQTTAPTQVLTTAETPSGASTTAGSGDGDTSDGTTETTQTQDPPAPPVVPEGYVPATEVESERAARTAAEEGRTTAETARAEAEARATAAERRAREAEIKSVARSLNFNDADDALTLVPDDATDIEAALKGVLEKKPYFAKQQEAPAPVVTPTSPTNPARTAALTPDAIKSMTPAQVSANWAAVKAALGGMAK